MSDIFLSYAREDRDKAKLLAEGLVDQGFSVWWDRRIVPGKLFDRVIEEEISSAKCVIVLWSTSSVMSDWVRIEAEEGRNKGILIPALLDTSRVPMAYRNIQAVDLTNWNGDYGDQNFQELIEAVATLVPRVDVPTTSTPALTNIQPSARKSLPSNLEIEGIQDDNVNSQPAPAGTPTDRPDAVEQKVHAAAQVVRGTTRAMEGAPEPPGAAEDATELTNERTERATTITIPPRVKRVVRDLVLLYSFALGTAVSDDLNRIDRFTALPIGIMLTTIGALCIAYTILRKSRDLVAIVSLAIAGIGVGFCNRYDVKVAVIAWTILAAIILISFAQLKKGGSPVRPQSHQPLLVSEDSAGSATGPARQPTEADSQPPRDPVQLRSPADEGVCPSCGHKNPFVWHTCQKCSAKLPRARAASGAPPEDSSIARQVPHGPPEPDLTLAEGVCPSCGHKNPFIWHTCQKCGRKLPRARAASEHTQQQS